MKSFKTDMHMGRAVLRGALLALLATGPVAYATADAMNDDGVSAGPHSHRPAAPSTPAEEAATSDDGTGEATPAPEAGSAGSGTMAGMMHAEGMHRMGGMSDSDSTGGMASSDSTDGMGGMGGMSGMASSDSTGGMGGMASAGSGSTGHMGHSDGEEGASGHAGHAAMHHQESSGIGRPGDEDRVDRVIEIVANDGMRFDPSVLEVRAGETIRFRIRNTGAVAHEFVLGDVTSIRAHAEAMRSASAAGTHAQHMANMLSLPAGARGDLVWEFTNTGRVEFACTVPGHLEAGMSGRIQVR